MIPLVKVSFRSNIFGIRYLLPICSTMPVNILGLVFTVRSLIAGMYKLQCIDPVDSGDRVCPLRQILAWGGVAGLHKYKIAKRNLLYIGPFFTM